MFGSLATVKTNLFHQNFGQSTTHFIDLLDSEVLEPLIERPNLLKEIVLQLPNQIKSIVLDEVQRAPELLKVLQSLMARNQHQFILTGSSVRKLKRGAANLLGGRAFVRKEFLMTYVST